MEVLLAVTILAMIFGIVFGTFFYTITNAEEQQERAVIYHKANFLLNDITQNTASAYVPFGGRLGSETSAETGETVETEETEQSIFMGTPSENEDTPVDSLELFTTNSRFSARMLAGEIAHVTYGPAEQDVEDLPYAVDENNPYALQCTVAPLLTETEDGGGVFQWTMNVHSLRFEYFDGTEWLPEWVYEDETALPAAVKVTLEIADSNGELFPFSTIARIPVNSVLEEPETAFEELEDEEQEEQEEDILEDQEEEEINPPADEGAEGDQGSSTLETQE